MANKSSPGAKPGREVIKRLEDCFQETKIGSGEELRKLWNFYKQETATQAIIRRVKKGHT